MAEQKSKDKPDNAGQVTETPDGTRVVRTVGRDFRVEGNDVDGYIGVSDEYRTYANPTERPYITEDEVKILIDADYPTDVERLTLQNAAATPVEVDEDEADTHPSKLLEEPGEADKDEDGKPKSDAEVAKAQGQGGTPGDPVTSQTTLAASGANPSPSQSTPKSTDTKSTAAKAADKK